MLNRIFAGGAVPNTDCTAAIQAALDEVGAVFCPDPGIGNYYGITSLAFKSPGTQLIGEGGAINLKYLGPAAAAAKMLVVDKTTYNAGNNYKDLLLDGFVVDGDGKALRGLDFKGFTRRCRVRNVYITNCVNPAQTVAGNVSTIKATSTPSTGETIALEFTVTVRGGGQTSTTASLAAGVTAAA